MDNPVITETETEFSPVVTLPEPPAADPPAVQDAGLQPAQEAMPAVLPALTITATVDAALTKAVQAMNAIHAFREGTGAANYAEAVQSIGDALRAAMHLEELDGPSAIRTVRTRLMNAAKARTETSRVIKLYDTRVDPETGRKESYQLPPDKQPKPKPGTYIQAYTRVMDLARWLPGVELWRKGKKPENGVEYLSEPGVLVQGTWYKSPVDALLDGRTLESVHQAWKNRVNPTVVDLAELNKQGPAAVRAGFGRFFVTVRDTTTPGGKRRVKVATSQIMLAAVIRAAYQVAETHQGWAADLDKIAIECMSPRAIPVANA